MSIEKLDADAVDPKIFRRHRVTETGDFFTVTELSQPKGSQNKIQKLSATEYVYLPDGEIREYKPRAKTRDESVKSLRRTMRHIRDLVNCNVRQDNADRVHWITLTYADRSVKGASGVERVGRDFDIFFKRFRRYCSSRGITAPSYITVLEPQREGVWHLHCLFIYSHKRPYIANEKVAAMWGQGFTKTQRLPHNNMGAYLTAYLSDAAIDDLTIEDLEHGAKNKEVKERVVDGDKKRFVKGARLYFYPSDTNIVRHSRDVIYPKTLDMTVFQMDILQKQGELLFKSAVKFIDDDSGYEMTVTRRVYRKRRCTPAPKVQAA